MPAEPRECGAEIAPGEKCAELAAVQRTRHIYQKREGDGGSTEHVLLETHYDVSCPKCGQRTHVQRYFAD